MLDVLCKSLQHSDLPFHDFVELVLYHPEFGYYAKAESPVGKEGDYVTSPVLSPVFSYSLGNLCREFMSRSGDGVWQVVDIGCGDGALIHGVGEIDAGLRRGYKRKSRFARGWNLEICPLKTFFLMPKDFCGARERPGHSGQNNAGEK